MATLKLSVPKIKKAHLFYLSILDSVKISNESQRYWKTLLKVFFTEIGTNIQEKILPSRKSYKQYLLNPNTTDEEIVNIISKLDTSNTIKCKRPNSVANKVINQIIVNVILVP